MADPNGIQSNSKIAFAKATNMTLVVAHASPDICFMVGDTLLSHAHFQLKGDIGPVNGEFHSLKIQILSGELAVAFAGNFDAAYSAVSTLKAGIFERPYNRRRRMARIEEAR